MFGHSLGALLAFEFVKSVYERYSIFPCHMIISAAKAPHFPFRLKHLSKLDIASLKKELIFYGGMDERILYNDELLDLFLPIIRSDFSINENYKYVTSSPFPFDISALSGSSDPTITDKELLGWATYTTGKFEPIFFSGGHFFIKDHQEKVLELIKKIASKYIFK